MSAPMFRLLYYLYARRLTRDVRRQPTPRHIGIILDGNRRHGRSLGITEPRELYDLGANKLDEVLDWCVELGILTVTLWVFSTDNFRRPAAEVSGILASVEAKLRALACDPAIHRRRVRDRSARRADAVKEDDRDAEEICLGNRFAGVGGRPFDTRAGAGRRADRNLDLQCRRRSWLCLRLVEGAAMHLVPRAGTA